MPKSQSLTKLSTKERITQAAYALFKARGYEQVKVNDICKECQITKTGFYYHFDSKQSLLSHFYQEVIERINQRALSFVLAENYWQQLQVVYDELIDASMELGADLCSQLLMMNLKSDQGSFDFNPALATLTTAIIKKAQQAGQIRNRADAHELFEAAAFAFLGCEVTWCIKKEKFSRRAIFYQNLELLFDLEPSLRSQQRHLALNEQVQ